MTRVRVLLAGAGVAGLGYGVAGLVTDPEVRLGGVLLFLVAVLVLHDAVWMPAVLAAGALIDRRVAPRWRRPARAVLLTGAALSVVGLPLAVSPGRPPDDPSVLPLDYGRNLAVLLAALIVAGLAAGAVRRKTSESTTGLPDRRPAE